MNVRDELGCDLLGIGSRGLSVFENVLMGSGVTSMIEGANFLVRVTRNLHQKYLKDACGI
jgi:nucleotide-binding universal stress UspA family protein